MVTSSPNSDMCLSIAHHPSVQVVQSLSVKHIRVLIESKFEEDSLTHDSSIGVSCLFLCHTHYTKLQLFLQPTEIIDLSLPVLSGHWCAITIRRMDFRLSFI
jgi:hypothetical protein